MDDSHYDMSEDHPARARAALEAAAAARQAADALQKATAAQRPAADELDKSADLHHKAARTYDDSAEQRPDRRQELQERAKRYRQATHHDRDVAGRIREIADESKPYRA